MNRPAHDVTIDKGKLIFVDRSAFDREVALAWQSKSARTWQVILRRKPTSRSRQAERFYWAVVVPLWAEYVGCRKFEAHEDLLDRFPVIAVDEEGREYHKRSRDMEFAEYQEYVFDNCVVGMAQEGVVCPDPSAIYVEA